MTFISCARLDDLAPMLCRLPHMGQHPPDFLEYLQIFCNTLRIFCNPLQIFCNTCRFSATLCRFSATLCRFSVIPAGFLQYYADFLQYLQIFCNTCRFSAIPTDFLQYLQIFCNTCGFSTIPADFLELSAVFPQYLEIFCNIMRNFCGASSDDINSCIYSAMYFIFSISLVVIGTLCALTNLPQFLFRESTTGVLCHINAVIVKSHLLVLVVEDITKGILVGSDLKMVKTTPSPPPP